MITEKFIELEVDKSVSHTGELINYKVKLTPLRDYKCRPIKAFDPKLKDFEIGAILQSVKTTTSQSELNQIEMDNLPKIPRPGVYFFLAQHLCDMSSENRDTIACHVYFVGKENQYVTVFHSTLKNPPYDWRLFGPPIQVEKFLLALIAVAVDFNKFDGYISPSGRFAFKYYVMGEGYQKTFFTLKKDRADAIKKICDHKIFNKLGWENKSMSFTEDINGGTRIIIESGSLVELLIPNMDYRNLPLSKSANEMTRFKNKMNMSDRDELLKLIRSVFVAVKRLHF